MFKYRSKYFCHIQNTKCNFLISTFLLFIKRKQMASTLGEKKIPVIFIWINKVPDIFWWTSDISNWSSTTLENGWLQLEQMKKILPEAKYNMFSAAVIVPPGPLVKLHGITWVVFNTITYVKYLQNAYP